MPILLPICMPHPEAEKLGKPVSAGMCRMTENGPVIDWESESKGLGLRPRPGDEIILNLWFGRKIQ